MVAFTKTSKLSLLHHRHEETNQDVSPDEFVCPITLTTMVHPALTKTGINYERDAIFNWVTKKGTCPMTRKPLKACNIISNLALERRIQLWREENGIPDPNDGQVGEAVGTRSKAERLGNLYLTHSLKELRQTAEPRPTPASQEPSPSQNDGQQGRQRRRLSLLSMSRRIGCN